MHDSDVKKATQGPGYMDRHQSQSVQASAVDPECGGRFLTGATQRDHISPVLH